MMNSVHDVTFRLREPVTNRKMGASPQSLDEMWVVHAPEAGMLFAAFVDAIEAHKFCEQLNIADAVRDAVADTIDAERRRKETPTT